MSLPAHVQRAWRRNRSEWLPFLAFVSPGLCLFALFTYWPIVYSAYLSLTDWNLIRPDAAFVGAQNYARLFRDAAFWEVMVNTFLYALCVVGAAQVLGFALAQLLNQPLRGRALLRTVAFTPYVTTPAAAALIFVLLLDPHYGPLSLVYGAFGIEGPAWLGNAWLALGALILVGIWKEISFAAVFFLAGLQGLPRECYEAAAIDGSSRLRTLWHLTIPLLSPVFFFLMVTGFIAATKTFDSVAIMTEGGPVYPDSSLYVYHLYELAFRDFRAGYASAMASVFFVATVALTALQFRWARRWVHYE
jgi:ABC-type sugar transport system permease subunit